MKKFFRYLGVIIATAIMDAEALFSNEQAITATATSTNIFDQGNAQGDGSKRVVKIEVTEAFATLTSLTIALRHDTAAGMGTAVVALQTPAIALADLTLGASFEIPIPKELNRYLDLNYTVAGTAATAGEILAGIVIGNDSTY